MDCGVEHRPTEITRAKVTGLAFAGYTQADIAKYLDISDETLRKYYKTELHNATCDVIDDVAKTALNMARAGDPKMIDLVLRCRARWSNYKPPETDDAAKVAAGALMQQLIDKL